MLFEDGWSVVINHLLIKRDFRDPNQFYFFPPAPRIHTDAQGRPAFQLLKYARDVTDNPRFSAETREQIGGGFLTMTVDIGVDQEVIEDTRNKLAAFATGTVQLGPVDFHTGTVRLVALGAENGPVGEAPAQPASIFVESIFGATKPTLYNDNLALFGMHLSQEGATLVEKSFLGGGGLIGVVYDLTYTVMRPSLEVVAEVDYSRVYTAFEAKIGFRYAMIAAELDATLEFLREQGAIKIEITQYDPTAGTQDALRREAMDLLKSEVIAKMFKPSLELPRAAGNASSPMEQVMRLSRDLSQPASPGAGGGQPVQNDTPPPVSEGDSGPRSMEGKGAAPQGGGGTGTASGSPMALTFSLKFVHTDERKKATFDFRVNQAVNRNAAPQGSLQLLSERLDPTLRRQLIDSVNLDDPFFNQLNAKISTAGDWTALGIEKVVVNATYQPRASGPVVHTDGWTFTSPVDAPKLFNVLIDRNNPVREYRYKMQAFLKDAAWVDGRERVIVKEASSTQRELVLHPANELRPLVVSVELASFDWTGTREIEVALLYADDASGFRATQRFRFTSEDKAARQWVVYPVNPDLRSYSVQLTYQLQDSRFTLEPIRHADEAFVVPGPFRAVRRLRLIPAVDWEEVRELTAEVSYEKGGYQYRREETFSQTDAKPRWVEIPIVDPDPKSDVFQARWTLTGSNWEVQEFPWRRLETSNCVMTDGVHGVEAVQLSFTRSVEAAGLTGLLVLFESLTADGLVVDADTLLLEGVAREAGADLLVMQNSPLRYRYRLTKMSGASSETVQSPEQRERALFVQL